VFPAPLRVGDASAQTLPSGRFRVHNEKADRVRAATESQKGDPRMGVDDVVNKGKDLYEQNKDKVDDALHSEQAEGVSDKVLDGVADFAKKIAPDASEKIDEIRNAADKSIGNE